MRPPGILSPRSLTIDVNTHLLWVGSSILNTVLGYRYITQYDITYGMPTFILICYYCYSLINLSITKN